jgi:predicted DNA-binding transcriptional regulator AlpA
MSQEPLKDDSAIEAATRDRRETIARLVASHGVDTLLVSIPRIARMLGYAPSTLYGYIKAGTFFLPYRLINGSPAIAVDDLVIWLSSRDAEIAPRVLAPGRGRAAGLSEGRPSPPGDTWRERAKRRALAAASAAAAKTHSAR